MNGALLAALVPAGVMSAECYELDDEVTGCASERRAVREAIPRRQREFSTGRRLAHGVVLRAGGRSGPIGQGSAGEPSWPVRVVGSITHCEGFVGAVAAPATHVGALGIDAEVNEPLPPGVLRTIASPQEVAGCDQWRAELPGVAFDRLLFCVKEVTYKVWYPLAHSWLGFEDAEVKIAADGTFESRLLRSGPGLGPGHPSAISGRWTCDRGLLVAAATLSAIRSTPAPTPSPSGATRTSRPA